MKNKLRKYTILIAVLTVVFIVTAAAGCTNYKKLRKTGGTVDGKPITEDTDVKTIVSQEVDETEWQSGMLNLDPTQIFMTASDGDKMPLDTDLKSVSVKMTQTVILTNSYNESDNVTYEASSIAKYTENTAYMLYTLNDVSVEAYIEKVDGSYIGYIKENGSEKWTKKVFSDEEIKKANLISADLTEEYSKFKYDTKANAYVGTISSSVILDKLIPNFSMEPFDVKMNVKFVNDRICTTSMNAGYTVDRGIVVTVTTDAQAIYYDYNNTVVEKPESITDSVGE